MKTSLLLFAAATLAPTLVLVGLSTTAAFGLAATVGISAMLIQDYGPKLSYHHKLAKVKCVTSPEKNPFAA